MSDSRGNFFVDSSVGRGGWTSTKEPQPYLSGALSQNTHDFFEAQAARWHRETAGHSSMTIRRQHPAFASIVQMGVVVVPFLLDKLKSMPDFWFPMLREITKENPVLDDHRGDFDKMVEDWTQWGRRHRYIK